MKKKFTGAQKRFYRKTKRKYKKRIPPHLRTPDRSQALTYSQKRLYDLIFSFGLGGCWMSNHTLCTKLSLTRRTIQIARKALFQQEYIIIARTNPHTFIMWSRYHKAVENAQVLYYPVKMVMDNPYYAIESEAIGAQSAGERGRNFCAQIRRPPLTGGDTTGGNSGCAGDRRVLNKETALEEQLTNLSQGSNAALKSASRCAPAVREEQDKIRVPKGLDEIEKSAFSIIVKSKIKTGSTKKAAQISALTFIKSLRKVKK